MARVWNKYKEWLEPDGLLRIEGWARDGLTDAQIARNMGIGYSTLSEWVIKFPEISDALKKGKAPVDIIVENALFKSATGFHEKVKKCVVVGTGTVAHIEEVEEDVYVPPNVTAQVFWLKNRRPDVWRDRRENTVKMSAADLDDTSRRLNEYFASVTVEEGRAPADARSSDKQTD